MTTEEAALRGAIERAPSDRTTQLVYADWLEENGRGAEAGAWRWVAAFRRKPCSFKLFRLDSEPYWAIARTNLRPGELYAGHGWGLWDFVDSTCSWPWSAGLSMLPRPLFTCLPTSPVGLVQSPNERCYHGALDAYDALIAAYQIATRPRRHWVDRQLNGPTWVPDWDLVGAVPVGEDTDE